LLVSSGLHKRDIEKVIESKIIELREWVKELLIFLSKNNIPLIIISANWLWKDSIKIYLEKEWFLTPNIKIISNEFIWDNKGNAIDYDKRVIHVFNKDETVLQEFPEIYSQIENRKNVILLWDSIWDIGMIEGFEYNNLLKIWFLNDKEEELLEEYKKNYDLVLTWDNDANLLSKILI
jgi:HAD superfamily hydrolase (TIGR01544 family)